MGSLFKTNVFAFLFFSFVIVSTASPRASQEPLTFIVVLPISEARTQKVSGS
jgi:hypothetical protein